MKRLAAIALLIAIAAHAQPLDRLARADGAHVLPDRFLRAYDPVTILFDSDTGPKSGGPEDNPRRLATIDPAVPGAWTWLGSRVLQFRPADPWTPLRRETVRLGRAATTLVPLLPMPTAAGPPDDPRSGAPDLDTLALTFPTPVDPAALARLTTVEIRPVGQGPAETLTSADFNLRPVERAEAHGGQTYALVLHAPVPEGRTATVHLKLSDEPGLDDPTFSATIHSGAAFALTDTYCGDGYEHALTDAVTVCQPDGGTARPRVLVLQFPTDPALPSIVQAREALRFDPPVDDLVVTIGPHELRIAGKFEADRDYALRVASGALADTGGRALAKPIALTARFTAADPALAWDATQGVIERLGPQDVPLRGHGYEHADLRIVPIDPLGRDFWPFPNAGLATSDEASPPLQGNEPRPYAEPEPIPPNAMAERIRALGTPAWSGLIDLPLRRGGLDAKFGIDLAAPLAAIAGARQPGAYLLGLRAVDGSSRHWARVQVTDLTLTTVEEADRVRFVVTSLATAQPVAGATVALDGVRDDGFVTLARGTTGADGGWTLAAPLGLGRDGGPAAIRRVVVTKGADTLVVDPARAPRQYADGQWTRGEAWLDWTATDPKDRREPARTLCRVFTERPIYRPEDKVLIAGMIRVWRNGGLFNASGPGEVIVTGPDEQEWRIPASLDEVGGFHVTFDARTEATGDYAIAWAPKNRDGGDPCGRMSVKKEAYRLPTFEVVLAGSDRAALDAPFGVDALARFFAGGLLADRPILWRVTQSPYYWQPPKGTDALDGFVFSSDSRYSGEGAFRSTPVLNRDAKTDAGGSARLTLDPTLEPTAQPRQYLVEATVTGDDDIQVRGVLRINALPPFILGVKAPRYLPKIGAIEARIVAADPDGKPLAGLPLTARLIHRQWNATLQASDFAQASAKYETQVFDETIAERHLTSEAAPTTLRFDAAEAGVYLVELEATDKAGRKQSVTLDLFMAGDTPVTWSRPPSEQVTISTDKDAYDSGQTATLIVQSPFQSGRGLVVTEEPEGRFGYNWIDIANGFGRAEIPIRKPQAPRLAVHVLLMRGRLPGTEPVGTFDQGKPVTLAATKWLAVTPAEHQVKVRFDAPETARPAQTIDLALHLADAAGKPLAGEATVWLVDQAVLSLAPEAPLDPVPAFLVDRRSRAAMRDTRNLAFGILPLLENPGGDENGATGMENISVRKNFTPVPFYAPRVKVGPDGTAHLQVKLPDSLTVFMLRAEAVSGPDRFGYGTGSLKVRQPVVAQPALPRFVRPGDRFEAAVIARIVEGPGGAGHAAVAGEGLAVEQAEQDFAWDGTRPARVAARVSVPEPPPGTETARLRLAVRRAADGVGDAVQIDLPLRPDRPVEHRRELVTARADGVAIPAVTEPLRPASYARTITLAADADMVKTVAGLNVLLRPPVGGPEQRLSMAEGELALLPFTPLLDAAGARDRARADIAAALSTVQGAVDDDGLVAFWPHAPGEVWMTARAYRVMVAADRLGIPIDKAQAGRFERVLTDALRSDYAHLLGGAELYDRVMALLALADGGKLDRAYANELARSVGDMTTYGVAQTALALTHLPPGERPLLPLVLDALWARVNILSRDGKPAYGGLRDHPASPSVLPSEAASLAATVAAVAAATPDEPRLPVLRTALLGLGDGQGWGNDRATAEALRALAGSWRPPPAPVAATITLPDRTATATLDDQTPLAIAATARPGEVGVRSPSGVVLAATDFVPAPPGAEARARQSGFALARAYWRIMPDQKPTLITPRDGVLRLTVGDVIEEVDDLVADADRADVALHLPLPAGLEPLNPALATAPAEATPSAPPTLAPSYARYGDDEVLAVWRRYPRGTATIRTRLRATTPGTFTAPPASAECLYAPGVNGVTDGLSVVVVPP